MGTPISPALWGWPLVRNSAERDGTFPVPDMNQRVHNLQTATLQRWNGSAWVDDFFAGSLSTGTPAVLWEGVTLVAQPTAIDFIGRVTGNAAGPTAELTIPELPVSNAGGVVVAKPVGLKFTGAGAIVTDAAGVATVAISGGGGGGGVDTQDEGTPVNTPASTLNFVGAGVTVTDATGGVSEITIPGGTLNITPIDDGDAGSGINIDFSAGENHDTLLTADATFTFTDPPDGDVVLLKFTQDGTGGWIPSWPANVNWGWAGEPDWVLTLGLVNTAIFYFDGTTYWGRAFTLGGTP
ncbi:MAG TPA: hypothetical protein VM487_12065 [Phycisphaerae bacterium]|nr:hypothetical protein [Phycisphaerae bacterium]